MTLALKQILKVHFTYIYRNIDLEDKLEVIPIPLHLSA